MLTRRARMIALEKALRKWLREEFEWPSVSRNNLTIVNFKERDCIQVRFKKEYYSKNQGFCIERLQAIQGLSKRPDILGEEVKISWGKSVWRHSELVMKLQE